MLQEQHHHLRTPCAHSTKLTEGVVIFSDIIIRHCLRSVNMSFMHMVSKILHLVARTIKCQITSLQ